MATEREPLARQSGVHLFRLGAGGRLLVGAARCWLSGGECWELTGQRFHRLCGAAAGHEALTCLEAFLEGLSRAARRAVYLNHPRRLGLSHDEWLLVQMVAAAQDDDSPALAAMLSLLFRRHEAERQFRLLAAVALHLRDAGLAVERHPAARPPERAAGAPGPLLACG